MKLILSILFSLQSVFAQTPAKQKVLLRPELIVYNPGGNTPGKFIVSYKDYEDVRLDTDLDGQIDYWRVRKGNLHVETFFKNGEVYKYFVRKVEQDLVHEFSYVNQSGHLALSQSRSREPFGRNFTTAEICGNQVESFEKKIEDLKSISRLVEAPEIVSQVVDDSCRDVMTDKDLRKIRSNLRGYFDDETASFDNCLVSDEFKKKFDVSDGDAAVMHDILGVNIQLQMAQIRANPSQHKGMIKCEMAREGNDSPAKTSENGEITLYKKTDKDLVLDYKILTHEFLHRSGLFSEETTTAISDFCFKNAKSHINRTAVNTDSLAGSAGPPLVGNASAANEKLKAESVATKEKVQSAKATPTRSIASVEQPKTGQQLASNTSTANIPTSMTRQETAIPEAQTLSMRISNPAPKTDVGAQQALTESVTESRSVLSKANNLIGAMSTPASAATLAEGKTRSKIEAKVDTVNFKARGNSEQVTGSGVRGVSADRLAAGDRVVEEITLDGSSSASNAIPAARSVASTTAGSVPASAPEQAAGRVASSGRGGGELRGGAGSSGAAGGGSGPSLGGSGGGGSGAIPPTRGIASTGDATVAPLGGAVTGGAAGTANNPNQEQKTTAGTAAPAAAAGRETVISMFSSRGSYAATKNRLKDQSFTQQLQAQNITIMDLYGNSYGAAKGEVIFLDEGNRFVRQK